MERWISLLICSVCGARLSRTGGVARCSNKHIFDIGREGYINLMTPNYWHQQRVRWNALAAIEGQPTTISVRILAFHRRR